LDSDQFRLHAEIEDKHWWFVARREIIRSAVLQVLAPSPEALIVEVGCGTGGNLAVLSRDHRCVGIDPSEEAIRFARERFPGIEFICGHAPAGLGDLTQKVDLFLLLDVLEHVEHDSEFIAELIDPMRPGAHLLLTVPADMSLWGPHDSNYGHFRRYEREQLKTIWAGLPVRVHLLSYFNTVLYPVVKSVRLLTRFRKTSWGESGTDLTVPPRCLNTFLSWLFGWEARALCAALSSERESAFSFGVSLIASLQRQ